MGAGHDADVDAVAVADRDDDAIMPLRPAAAMYSLPSDPRELEFFFAGLSAGASMPSSLSSSCSSSLAQSE